jgi:hypothetical protein
MKFYGSPAVFFEKNEVELLKLIRFICGKELRRSITEQDVRDLLSEAYIRCVRLKSLDRYRADLCKLSSWIYFLLRGTCQEHYAQKLEDKAVHVAYDEDASVECQSDAILDLKLGLERLGHHTAYRTHVKRTRQFLRSGRYQDLVTRRLSLSGVRNSVMTVVGAIKMWENYGETGINSMTMCRNYAITGSL